MLNKFLYVGGPQPLTFYIPFFTISYTFYGMVWYFFHIPCLELSIGLLTAGNPHCHKIGISHKYRTLSRRVRGWTSRRILPVQIFVDYLALDPVFQAKPPCIGHHREYPPSPRARQEIITFPDKETYMHACGYPAAQNLPRKP